MPYSTGSETIHERLERLRSDLARVRETIERVESNGQENTFNGQAVTEIAYERALVRESKLAGEIQSLERRLAGKPAHTRKAIIKSVSS